MRKNIFLILKRNYEGEKLSLPKKKKIELASVEIYWKKYLIHIIKYKIILFIPLLIMRGTMLWIIWAKIPWKKKNKFYKNIILNQESFLLVEDLIENLTMDEYSGRFISGYIPKRKSDISKYYIPGSIKNLYNYSFFLEWNNFIKK